MGKEEEVVVRRRRIGRRRRLPVGKDARRDRPSPLPDRRQSGCKMGLEERNHLEQVIWKAGDQSEGRKAASHHHDLAGRSLCRDHRQWVGVRHFLLRTTLLQR